MVNSFIFKRLVESKVQLLLISLLSEKVYDVTEKYKNSVRSAYIVLTDAEVTNEGVKKIRPLVEVELSPKDGEGIIEAGKLSKDFLITSAYQAAKVYVDIKKQVEDQLKANVIVETKQPE